MDFSTIHERKRLIDQIERYRDTLNKFEKLLAGMERVKQLHDEIKEVRPTKEQQAELTKLCSILSEDRKCIEGSALSDALTKLRVCQNALADTDKQLYEIYGITQESQTASYSPAVILVTKEQLHDLIPDANRLTINDSWHVESRQKLKQMKETISCSKKLAKENEERKRNIIDEIAREASKCPPNEARIKELREQYRAPNLVEDLQIDIQVLQNAMSDYHCKFRDHYNLMKQNILNKITCIKCKKCNGSGVFGRHETFAEEYVDSPCPECNRIGIYYVLKQNECEVCSGKGTMIINAGIKTCRHCFKGKQYSAVEMNK